MPAAPAGFEPPRVPGTSKIPNLEGELSTNEPHCLLTKHYYDCKVKPFRKSSRVFLKSLHVVRCGSAQRIIAILGGSLGRIQNIPSAVVVRSVSRESPSFARSGSLRLRRRDPSLAHSGLSLPPLLSPPPSGSIFGSYLARPPLLL